MPDIPDSSLKPKSRFARGQRKVAAVPREVIMGLDDTERKISLLGGVLAIIASAGFADKLFKNTTIQVTAKYVKGKACPAGYHALHQTCTKALLTHPSYWLFDFLLPIVAGIIILLFATRRMRVGVIVASLMLGLAGGAAGFIFLFLGAWLVVRAFRLQKYGEASFSGSSRRARELSQERRAARETTPRGTKVGRSTRGKAAAAKSNSPAPSKRYTPKKTTRRK